MHIQGNIKRQMDVNFTGALVSTRTAIKVMREQNPPGGINPDATTDAGDLLNNASWRILFSHNLNGSASRNKRGVAKFGRIDVVVNNGGYGLSGPFEDLTDEDIKRRR
jgi:NAD(P)-dependent dehydrogenase (short-subunit alcohol dehydrogenase family)